ncbi:hypothetical protein [Marinibacterium profundimaris]|uniref:hypothetical protein n=1 Tax=Marinibacterium profundimaris TaxID=1679460 RepID=UPI000B525467|nr:hypothetical protein [Marinibacterium profundimaris]
MRLASSLSLLIPAAALAALAACDDAVTSGPANKADAPASIGLFGDGYPQPGDACYRAGETPVTSPYLDDSADLVACPPNTEAQSYAAATGGRRVAVVEGWQLFSIPR